MDNDLKVSWLNDTFRSLYALKKVTNQEDFGVKLGYGKTYISELLNGKKPVTDKVLKKVREKFDIEYTEPQLPTVRDKPREYNTSKDFTTGSLEATHKRSAELLGKNPNQRMRPEDWEDAFPDWEGLPFYNVPVTASFIETYRDEHTYRPQFFVRDPRFKDCDFAAIVTGDSMHSEIRHGDFIICKEITDRRFIVYGDIYYIVSTNGLETCKYINADTEDRNNYMLIAKNEHISPAPLPKDMILKLYKVRGILRGY